MENKTYLFKTDGSSLSYYQSGYKFFLVHNEIGAFEVLRSDDQEQTVWERVEFDSLSALMKYVEEKYPFLKHKK